MLNKPEQKLYDSIIRVLKDKKVRITNVRSSIIKILITSDHPTTTSIIKKLEDEYGNINVMSVYNTMDLLLSEHILSANTFNGKQICYEIVASNAVHFTCINCNKLYHVNIEEFRPDTFQDLKEMGNTVGFSMDHFKIECHGICKNCCKKQEA